MESPFSTRDISMVLPEGKNSYLDTLPDSLLDNLVATSLHSYPFLRSTFLASLGLRVHESAIRVLFGTLSITDSALTLGSSTCSSRSVIFPILSNPQKYGAIVRKITVLDPVVASTSFPRFVSPLNHGGEMKTCVTDSLNAFHPIQSEDLVMIFKSCPNLEELDWRSIFLPPDGLCEALVTHNTRLTRFSYSPALKSRCESLIVRCNLPKWDGLSLPLLVNLPVVSLKLSRLSQIGSKALAHLLSTVGEYSSLEEVHVDFIWLDDYLCEKLVEAGKRIRRLKIGTNGTKLSDRGIIAIVEGCENLEDFSLDGVQGRLTRHVWSKLIKHSPMMKSFQVIINEHGPHHSWTTDHLSSLYAIPFNTLSTISIIRQEAPPRLENGLVTFDTTLDDTVALKPVPAEFIQRVKEYSQLTTLECDWWAWGIADLRIVLESCCLLENVRICLDAPFAKLLALTSTFSSLSKLQKLSICVNPIHAPGKPPRPSLPITSSLPTPAQSPNLRAKSVLPQLLDFDQMKTQTCLSNDVMDDPSMPLLRDIKRFVRRCPKLTNLEWYGKYGRGTWLITRPSTTSKISMNVSVEYHSPSITEEAWRAMLREEDVNEAMEQGWSPNDIERVGRAWTSEGAEAYARLFVSKEDSNISKTAKDKAGKLRDIRKPQPGLPPISTSDFGDICQPSTPSQSSTSISRSPEMPYTPLTPAPSEISNSSSSRRPNPDLSVDDTCGDEYQTIHKRSPSEPCRTSGELSSRRTRTTTGTMYKGTVSYPGYSNQESGSDEAHTKNRRPGKGSKKSAVDNGDPSSRGRGKGNERSQPFSGPGISGGGGRRRRSGELSIPSTRL